MHFRNLVVLAFAAVLSTSFALPTAPSAVEALTKREALPEALPVEAGM